MRRFFRILFILLLVLLVGVGLLLVSHGFLYPSGSHPAADSLTILTFNTHSMGQARKTPDNNVIRFLRQTDADILCLQEVDVYKSDRHLTLSELKSALDRYPYTYFDFKVYNSRHQFGNAVFSKYPLINKHTIRYPSRANISSCCDILFGQDTIRLFTNHLESYRFTESELDSVVAHPFQADTVIRRKAMSASRSRFRQARIVADSVDASPYPVILVGDLNSTPVSPAYLLLRCRLRDAFLRCSSLRLGSTFRKGRFGIRIDYILHSEQLHPTDCHTVSTTASDHLPLRAAFILDKSHPPLSD